MSLSRPLVLLALLFCMGAGHGLPAQSPNLPPEGLGILPDEVGVHFSAVRSEAITALGGAVTDASPDGEFLTSTTGGQFWVQRHTPVSTQSPPPAPLDEVDLYWKDGQGQWTYQTTLEPPLAGGNASGFGSTVVAAGNRLFIGAPGALNSSSVASGVVYVYEITGSVLTPVQTIEPPSGVAGDQFGAALAVESHRLLIGAPGRDRVVDISTTLVDAGAVFLYEKDTTWDLLRTEWSASPQAGAQFGFSVGLHGRGYVVGAPFEDAEFEVSGTPTVLQDAGAVYLGRWDHAATWLDYKNLFSLYAPIQAKMAGLAHSHFGWSVCMDGLMRVAVSMPDSSWTAPDGMAGWDSGLVMIMHWNGAMTPDEAFVRTAFSHAQAPAGARFGEHVEAAQGGVDFGVRTGQRQDNVPLHYYVVEAIQAQPGSLVGSVETPRRVGDLTGADPEGDALAFAIPTVGNPYGIHFSISSTGELRAKSTLATLLDGVYSLTLSVADGGGVPLLRTFSVEVSGAVPDADRDKMADSWEASHGLNPALDDAAADPDQDGLTNLQEYAGNTDPMDPEGPLLMGGYIDLRPYLPLASQDQAGQGTVTVVDGGQGLALTGNRWVRVPFAYTVTPHTVIEFEFKGTVQGEIHAVGLDEDLVEGNAPRLAQVWGTTPTTAFTGAIAPGDFDAYKHHANNWAPIRVRLGQYYTGLKQHLIIANDHDDGLRNASTEIRKIRVYEAPIFDSEGYVDLRPFGGYAQSYDGDKPKQGTVTISQNHREVAVTGNRWLQWMVNYNVTPLTMMEFTYRTDTQGEVHGLGLDEDTQLNNHARLFQVHGTQYWESAIRVGSSDWYPGPPGTWKDYRISVGKSYEGLMRYLMLGNDHDVVSPTATARYKNIRIYEAQDSDEDQIPDWWELQWGTDPEDADAGENPDGDDLNNLEEYQNNSDPLDPEGPLLMGGYLDLRPFVSHAAQDVPSAGTVTVANKGQSMTITGNRWVRVPYDYNVTANTVMELEFRGTQQGEIHAVGLDDDTLEGNGKRLCQLWGTDVWGSAYQPGDYEAYSHHAPDWKTYRIRVGKLNTGTMHHFFIVNDDDNAPRDSSTEIRNVRFYEAPINDAAGRVDLRYWSGYGLLANDGDVPKSGYVVPNDGGRELAMQGNHWLQVLVDYPVTRRTVVEFLYRSDVEGETHGLGLDENTELAGAPRVFRIHGTQASSYSITTPPSLRYRDQGSWRQYRLPVGRTYPAGVMRYLVLAGDDDRLNPTATSAFRDVRIFEETDTDGDGMPDAWEIAHSLNIGVAADAGADQDHDGLTNLQEYDLELDPDSPDTNGDHLPDKLSADRLVAHWRMDSEDDVGDIIRDVSASKADLTLHDEAYIASSSGLAATGALRLGTNTLSRAQVPPDLLEMQADVSISFWMQSSAKGEMSILSGASTENHNAYLLMLKDETLRLYTGVHADSYVEWDVSITDGSWHHVLVMRGRDAGEAKLYVDGDLIGVRTATFVLRDIDLVVLGHEADSIHGDFVPSQRFRGFIDEMRIYQRILSDGEVRALSIWQPRLQGEIDSDHDGMMDSWEQENGVEHPYADHDGDGKTNLEEFQAGTDPLDYYNGVPPTLQNIFSPSGSTTDLQIRLGIRDPGEEDDDAWKMYVNGIYIGRNFPTNTSSSEFNYSSILYLPVGVSGVFTFELASEENGTSFALDILILNNVQHQLIGYSTAPQGSGYTFTIDVQDDFDHDGLLNAVEAVTTTDPWDPDSDDDGLPDGWEFSFGLNPKSGSGNDGSGGDPDQDELTNTQEFALGTDPTSRDSDNDRLPDGWEISYGLNPRSGTGVNGRDGDFDGDGLTNLEEIIHRTDPSNPDSDQGGGNDGSEVDKGSDPNKADDDQNPPAEGEVVDVPFSVGDPSGSHSERWRMVIEGKGNDTRAFNFEPSEFGAMATKTFKLRRDGSYEISVKWLDTSPEHKKLSGGKSDFDWEARVNSLPNGLGTENENKCFLVRVEKTVEGKKVEGKWVVENTEGVLTTERHGDDNNIADGKKALMKPVDLVIHHGSKLVQEVPDEKEDSQGAFTLANLNDTDGDHTSDSSDTSVKASDPGKEDEIDLIKLVVKGPVGIAGKTRVVVESGLTLVKFWKEKTKEEEITLTQGAIEIDSADLPKVVWVECINHSQSPRDIKMKLAFAPQTGALVDNIDVVTATAIWSEITSATTLYADGDTTWFPHSTDTPAFKQYFTTNMGGNWGFNKVNGAHFGIGFGFKIVPAGVTSAPGADVLHFDITRQVRGKYWFINGATVTEGALPQGITSTFPAGDLPNDDDVAAQDDDEDVIPESDYVYSLDAPGINQATLTHDQHVLRFHFNEFLRVNIGGARPSGNNLDGSRASTKFMWHSYTWVQRGAADQGTHQRRVEPFHNESKFLYEPPNLDPAPTP